MYLGKMIEVTREAPANLGTAMKTIIARFEDMKKDPMAILEDGASANKVEAALATIGIALRDTAGEFRPLQDVMDELGMKWNSLTRNQQAYIATVAAGSRQQSRFLALMNNYDRTLDLINESQNSAGAAAEQYAIYQDSAAAATARLTAAWEEFYSKIVNSEQIIWVINALEKLVETMSKIGPVATAIGTTVGALGLNLVGKAVIPKIVEGLGKVASTGQATSLSIGAIIKGGGALLITFGKVAAVVGAVSIAIYSLIKAGQWLYDQFHQDEIAAKNLSNEIKNLDKKLSEIGQKTNSLEKLLNKYDELNNKIYLTEEEQQELNNTIEEISQISEVAIRSIDDMGNAHLRNRDAIKEELDLTKEIQKLYAQQELQKLLGIGNIQDVENLKNLNFNTTAAYVESYQQRKSEFDSARKNIKSMQNMQIQEGLEGLNYLDEITDLTIAQIRNSLEQDFPEIEWDKVFNVETLQDAIQASDTPLEVMHEVGKLIEEYYNNLIISAENAEDFSTNFNNYFNEELSKKLYSILKSMGGSEAILGEILEKNNISFDMENLVKLYNLIYGLGNEGNILNIDSILQDYQNGKISENEILQKLYDTIDALDNVIDKHLDDIQKEAEKEKNKKIYERGDFITRAEDFLSPVVYEKKFGTIDRQQSFLNNNKITSSDLNYIETFSKLKISDSSKISLFDFILQDENDKFQKLAQEYIDSLSNGFSDNTLQLQDQIISVLTNINIPDEDIQRIVNDFVPTYKELLEQRIDEDFGNYNNTRKGINDLTKLKNKERKQFLSENENADKYFEYNEDGEEYLNILGKIILLEQQREKIESEINSEIIASKAELSDNEKEIKRIKDLGDLASDTEKTNLITLQEENKELREANSLYEKQLTYINQSSNLQEYESMALQSNLDRAKKASDNIATIGKVWAEYQTSSSDSYIDLMNSLNALDSSYQSLFATVDDKGNQTLTLNQEIVDQMIAGEKDKYETWRTGEIKRLQGDMVIAQQRADILQHYLDTKGTEEEFAAKEAVIQAVKEANGENDAASNGYEKGLINNANFYNEMSGQAKQYFDQVTKWAQVVYANIANPNNINLEPIDTIDAGDFEATGKVKFEDIDISEDDEEEFTRQVEEALASLKYQISIDEATIAKLGDLSPEFKKSYDKAIADAVKGGSKEAEKAAKKLQKAIDDLLDSLEDLDKLLIEIKRDLKDISVDYNPFTDLFEAWEHEWDYYYNIKRLIAQIGTQGQLIDNLANAEYASADQRIQADHAKMGNILANMGANDTYITSLRAGLAQRANEIMEKYGDYYKINPDNMQIYQTDSNLMDINNAINQTGQEIYDLQKLQNEKENNLNLEQAKLDALEQEKSAYEEILSTIDSQIDSLKDNKDITIDLSELQNQKTELKAKIKVSDDSIDEAKQTIRDMEDELQEIEVNITLKGQVKQQMEDFVGDMEEARDAYEEMWDTLYETVGSQQELLSQLYDVYRTYYDAALETQQNLYDAIVENYQKEIDQKKRQYDYLKQLDQDYLNSIKNNISKERQIREDAAKQRSYQQSLQRAQLLQMDTSGAFRNDLANLNKEIADQRQELYDDLVDKQVDALEKEVEKRHELYDKEVAALEERLAYMQENAILLWAMVNDIVSQGSEAMMQTLEGTAQYLNANELQRQDARNTWELNVKRTFEGVNKGYIISVSSIIAAGNQFIEAYPELKTAVDDYAGVFESAKKAIDDYNISLSTGTGKTNQIFEDAGIVFGQIITDFMESWHNSTSSLTGYTGTWEEVIGTLKDSIDQHMQELEGYYTSEGIAISDSLGSISDFQQEIEGISSEMYEDFIEQRRQYRDELDSIIKTIQSEIEAAIKGAAGAIQRAADSITFSAPTPTSRDGGDKGGGGDYTSSPGTPGGKGGYKGYTVWVNIPNYNLTGKDYSYQERATFNDATYEQLYDNYKKLVDSIRRKYSSAATFWGFTPFKTGGLADFTGPAWLDGTKSQPERILSPRQTHLFESMVSSLEKTSNNSTINSALGSSYNIGDINTNINVEKLDNEADIDKVARQVENRIMKSIRNRVSVAIA